MENAEYRLRCSVRGHTSDVRAVKPLGIPGCGFITGSRDKTVRVWQPLRQGTGYEQVQCLTGATHFISSLCTLPPSPEYPCGLILAGSHDGSIYGYSIDCDKPSTVFLGHTSTVTSMVPKGDEMFISGSWDKTARVWHSKKCVSVLEGHQEAVWAVEVMRDERDVVLTASADKTIRLWRSGTCETVFVGHEHCVRGLAVTSTGEILSCSNDHTVRLWKINGDCVGLFHGHEHYIYSIALLNEDGDFVTSSEDRTVRVWRRGITIQTIKLPALSLWSVACLENGDLVIGGSDSTVRIFTKHEDFVASDEEIANFEAEVRGVENSIPGSGHKLGDLNVDDLPGPEILKTSGKRNGQTILCREGEKACVYEWDGNLREWMKIGDVVGANDDKKKSNVNKPDYVFSIETEEGRYLSLPYSLSEDPWMVAENFIREHSLHSKYLTKIANFIVTNTAHTSLVSMPSTSSAVFSDPFTGADSHIPSSVGNGNHRLGSVQSPAKSHAIHESPPADSRSDPFQLPGGDNPSVEDGSKFYPLTSYVTFDIANIDGMRSKLIEINDKVLPAHKATVEEIQELMSLADFPEAVTDSQLVSLDKLMSWPEEYVFPVLDLFRLAARSAVIGQRIGQAGNATIVNYLTKYMHPSGNPVNTMLAARAFCNFFCHEAGGRLLSDHAQGICVAGARCIPSDNEKVEVAVTTLFLNYATALHIWKPLFFYNPAIVDGVKILVNHTSSSEAIYRLLVCIGTLMEHAEAKAALKCVEQIKCFVDEAAASGNLTKIKQCAKLLVKTFES